MEEDHNILANGRQHQYFGIWKMTSIFWKLEQKPQYFGKQKTTSILWQMEDDINVLKLEDELIFLLGKDD